jgi:hypothetical protein
VETTLDRSVVTGVATGDGDGGGRGNPKWVPPPLVLLSPTWYWLEVGDGGGDFGVRGGAAVVGGDNDGEHPRMFSFLASPLLTVCRQIFVE